MSAELPTRLSAIDYTLDLEKLTKDFTGRQWVFDDIDRWLRESDERFFILTWEPGVVKSAIAILSNLDKNSNQTSYAIS